jgi:hypothetical protein
MPSYLIKYLQAELGANYILSKNDSLGRMLFHLCDKKKVKISLPQKQLYFIVQIPFSYFHTKGIATISDAGVKEFNLWANQKFIESLVLYIESRSILKAKLKNVITRKEPFSIQQSILDFFELYGISEEEYKLETARKYYDRWNNKRKQAQNRINTHV